MSYDPHADLLSVVLEHATTELNTLLELQLFLMEHATAFPSVDSYFEICSIINEGDREQMVKIAIDALAARHLYKSLSTEQREYRNSGTWRDHDEQYATFMSWIAKFPHDFTVDVADIWNAFNRIDNEEIELP